MCVLSMNEIEASQSIPQMKTFSWTSTLNYCSVWYIVLVFFWVVYFIEYKTQFIVEVSTASYYFDSNAKREGSASVCLGIKFAYFNHMGSIALGAFIIGYMKLIKIIFVYAARMAASFSGGNKCSACILKCGLCYLNCLERVTDYIHEGGFAYMAVSGEGFCMSAWNGFLLNIKHIMKFSFANLVANLLIFVGKLGITIANVLTLVFIMNIRHSAH